MANYDGFTTVQRNTSRRGRGRGGFQNRVQRREYDNNYQQRNASMSRVVVKSTQTKRKSSRTLLLKGVENMEYKYEGLQNVDKSPQGNVFLVFDTLENARRAFKDLRINKVNCKYSYYKLFFKSSNIDASKNYDELKGAFLSVLNEKVTDINVLYFKYYKREGVFTGSGDFVVDRKVDCDSLVTNRTLKFSDSNEVSFYRFRTNRGGNETSNNLNKQKDTNSENNSEEEIVNE